MDRPALWAGLECTVNRVGDARYDQCARNGHDRRLEDLERFASLGIQKIRYPFLWEKMAPRCSAQIDWSWADERNQELRRLNLQPIAGFVHHGSGPRYTDLLDPEFPEKLADFSRRFAERYPWIEDYTPVNEPLTTARFSGLYGIWHPHGRDERTFFRTLVTEIKAIALAMREIRKATPRARLIQTEDLGRATSTPRLAYQAEFENLRRWLSFDLLCGRVTPDHPLYLRLLRHGISEDELDEFVERPTVPDVLGVNHYLLSNRFLDERLSLYPEIFHGGNGKDRYADVGAVDVSSIESPTARSIFREVWERYRIPIAVTEVHVPGTRETQLQWLAEIWESASALKQEGVEVVAVTPWSLLGAFDWNTLCTRDVGHYESGVFDLRSEAPRPTALAGMIRSLAERGEYLHPVLEQKGWWHRARKKSSRPILITGATGTLGKAFARICEARGLAYQLLERRHLDIADAESVRSALESLRPWAVVNAAGYVRVDAAEMDRERCFRENTEGPELLARACTRLGIRLMNFSSDLVFDGDQDEPYREGALTKPLNVYGESKAESEWRVQKECPESLVVRTSSFFSPWDEANFVTQTLRALVSGRSFEVLSDVTVSPTYLPDLVNVALDLMIDGESGVIHLTNQGSVTWEEFARSAIRSAEGVHVKSGAERLLLPRTLSEMAYAAVRPRFSALSSERVRIMPPVEEAIERYVREMRV